MIGRGQPALSHPSDAAADLGDHVRLLQIIGRLAFNAEEEAVNRALVPEEIGEALMRLGEMYDALDVSLRAWFDRGDSAPAQVPAVPDVVVELLSAAIRSGEFPDTGLEFTDEQGGVLVGFVAAQGRDPSWMEERPEEERRRAQAGAR